MYHFEEEDDEEHGTRWDEPSDSDSASPGTPDRRPGDGRSPLIHERTLGACGEGHE
ncbi:hypothetical protein [Streptomyces broussonetiae]|uniref:hypothetical protein n=1 Tax=Streptomyces broussonetiae TaxID=2686304 RepID=UPI0035D6ACAA